MNAIDRLMNQFVSGETTLRTHCPVNEFLQVALQMDSQLSAMGYKYSDAVYTDGDIVLEDVREFEPPTYR